MRERPNKLRARVHGCVCASTCGQHTWQMRKRGLGAHQGPISPVCSKGLFITASRREQYSTARQLHLLPFSLILPLSSWNTTVRHLDFPQCTTARLWSRDWLLWALRGFKAVASLECVLSLSLYFSSVMFLRVQINQMFLVLGSLVFVLHVGSESFKLALKRREGARRRQQHRKNLHLKDDNTLRMQQIELEWTILVF